MRGLSERWKEGEFGAMRERKSGRKKEKEGEKEEVIKK